jgi:gluconate 2-dehydrogenase gamma chain
MDKVTRRSFVTAVGAASVVPATALLSATTLAAAKPAQASRAAEPADSSQAASTYLFFSAEEVLFIEAACERLIPADESGPGALGAGVPNYIDKQLGGAWGRG